MSEGIITVTKVFRFCYAHKLNEYNGPCKRIHGHNARVEITLFDPGWGSKTPGIMVDFSDVKRLVEREVVGVLDHHLINDLPEFPDNPTAENFCLWIRRRIDTALKEITPNSSKCRVYKVRFYETDDSYAEWRLFS